MYEKLLAFEFHSFNEIIRKVQMLEKGCEVLQRRQEIATQKRGANQFQQQNQFGGDKRQRVQGESSQGQRQQPQQQRTAPQGRAPQQPNRPQGNQGQQQPRPQQQQPRDDGRVQCWDCGERGHVKRNCPRGNRQQTGGVTQGRMFAISQDNARVSDDVIEGRILLYDVWVGEYPKPSSFYQWEVFGTSNTYRKVLSAT
ncbi:zinc finger protein [Macleaya cordata]|uniref:Zinc finger protein n=1 Tax=Macleaya cordata TaxID=56857 RepID=A0A200QG77_MACCD|nr:zinc finger protein [Macleaya cordata]